jgi:superoxide dismutase
MHLPAHEVDRRHMLRAVGVGALGIAGGCVGHSLAAPAFPPPAAPADLGWDAAAGQYVLPALPYAHEALEPHIDRQTMELHHGKHHAAYVRGLNSALEQLAAIRTGQSRESVQHWSGQLAFHASGHFLHVVFWNCMSPSGGGEAQGALGAAIARDFGSFRDFATHFKAAATAVEGSGWGLLALEPASRRLLVMQAEKHQNLTAWGVVPLVAVDVWEHAYYLKYQNRRREYVDAFMNVVDWSGADRRYAALLERLG